MALITLMAPIAAVDIVAGEPLPYAVYLANGVPIALRGQRLSDPDQLEILRRQGWRGLTAEDDSLADAITPEEAALRMDQQVLVRFRPQPRPPLPDATALVADDVPVTQKLLARMLRDEGVGQVAVVKNGRQAVALFFQQRQHLVFLDIDMPGLDGINTLEQIKAWSPETFVCMVSGDATLTNITVARSHGVDAFLAKPFSGLQLTRVLSLYSPAVKTSE